MIVYRDATLRQTNTEDERQACFIVSLDKAKPKKEGRAGMISIV